MNLDLMLDYGAESWKQYNEVLQDMLTRIQVHTCFTLISLVIKVAMKQRECIEFMVELPLISCPPGPAWGGQEADSGSQLEQEEPADTG